MELLTNPDGTPDINDITKAGEAATGFVGALNKLLPGISLASLHRAERRGTKLEMKDIETIVESGKRLGLSQSFVDDLIREAMARHRRTVNLEGVMSFAEQDTKETANVTDVDDEWLEHFQDHAEKVSDESMQVIWGKILSGEINKPGTYSKRLLDVLSKMSTNEAKAFRKVCDYSVTINFGNEIDAPFNPIPVLVKDDGKGSFNNGSVPIESLGILDSIGLVDSSLMFNMKFAPSFSIPFRVGSSVMAVKNDGDKECRLNLKNAVFLPLGKELAKVCGIGSGDGLDELFEKAVSESGLSLIRFARS